ncbi:hypothetical protein ACFO3J_28775 [Streptomyces polygonati]|uniref:Uncharacterized protein n=1 Tax=Streptomyces polygonati TaxID=1617087 RepID=A0ABV8HTZ9_9ACTN
MDELVGALIRGVFWVVGQILKGVLELVVSDAVEKALKSAWRRFAGRWVRLARRSRRKGQLPGGVSLSKDR